MKLRSKEKKNKQEREEEKWKLSNWFQWKSTTSKKSKKGKLVFNSDNIEIEENEAEKNDDKGRFLWCLFGSRDLKSFLQNHDENNNESTI